MNQALLYKNIKDSFGESKFIASGESLTSSAIGLLQYLSGRNFWNLLRNSCGEKYTLTENVRDLIAVYFWPRFLPD